MDEPQVLAKSVSRRVVVGEGDERPANQELFLLSPVFSQVAYIRNLDAKAQRALYFVFCRWGINELARITPAPQRYLTGTADVVKLCRRHSTLMSTVSHAASNYAVRTVL